MGIYKTAYKPDISEELKKFIYENVTLHGEVDAKIFNIDFILDAAESKHFVLSKDDKELIAHLQENFVEYIEI
jgi:hypothetical protein